MNCGNEGQKNSNCNCNNRSMNMNNYGMRSERNNCTNMNNHSMHSERNNCTNMRTTNSMNRNMYRNTNNNMGRGMNRSMDCDTCGRKEKISCGGCDRGNEPVDEMMPAMAFVPWQKWEDVYCIEEGLENGTIFAQLNKPLIGRPLK